MIRIYTSNYKNCKSSKTVSISGDGGKAAHFEGTFFRELAPDKDCLQTWKTNVNDMEQEQNLQACVESYYENVLKRLTPTMVLLKLTDGTVLVDYADPKTFSYRYVVAAWLELYYGIDVYEVKVFSNGRIRVLPRNDHYDVIKDTVKKLIMRDMDIDEQSCIASVYAYRVAEQVVQNRENGRNTEISAEMAFRMAEAVTRKLEAEKRCKK